VQIKKQDKHQVLVSDVLTSAAAQLNCLMHVQLNTRWVEWDQLNRLAVPPADSATIKALTKPKAPAEA
jgi:hypothetical protein